MIFLFADDAVLICAIVFCMCRDTLCIGTASFKGMCSTVACCQCIVLCNSVFADRSGMAAFRFLVAAAAGVILFRFAAESRKSHCNSVNGALAFF